MSTHHKHELSEPTCRHCGEPMPGESQPKGKTLNPSLVASTFQTFGMLRTTFSSQGKPILHVTRWLDATRPGQWHTGIRMEPTEPWGISPGDASLLRDALDASLQEAKRLELEKPSGPPRADDPIARAAPPAP